MSAFATKKSTWIWRNARIAGWTSLQGFFFYRNRARTVCVTIRTWSDYSLHFFACKICRIFFAPASYVCALDFLINVLHIYFTLHLNKKVCQFNPPEILSFVQILLTPNNFTWQLNIFALKLPPFAPSLIVPNQVLKHGQIKKKILIKNLLLPQLTASEIFFRRTMLLLFILCFLCFLLCSGDLFLFFYCKDERVLSVGVNHSQNL